jgi:hypothetical protein
MSLHAAFTLVHNRSQPKAGGQAHFPGNCQMVVFQTGEITRIDAGK